ncbi:hypothetical protein CTAYLR_009906 [Chrysophaeum taylorii]|uniref:Uncharacterized protein n=1 Tax=Chrysophaeum taylorii TaxID=2483200 RepID=A0AAD7UB90_9STRA|nr:hypothetical protein CTAYLR_009906 [Chrysophaeum taylorii]
MLLLDRELIAGGVTALAYGGASLALVCLNHQVLDAWAFPSTTLILIAQVACTLASCSLAWAWGGREAAPLYGELVRTTAPKMAALFVLDVALGHAATRSLGLDAFAAFRRFSIPFAMHLESRLAMRPQGPSPAVFCASWSMVLGPLLGLFCGRGKAASFARTATETATDAAVAYAESASQVSTIILGKGGTKPHHHHAPPSAHLRMNGPWDATTSRGCAAAVVSALVVAARVVLLRRALTKCRELDERDEIDSFVVPVARTPRSIDGKCTKRVVGPGGDLPSPCVVDDGESTDDEDPPRWPSLSKLDHALEAKRNRRRRIRTTWLAKSQTVAFSFALLVRTSALSLPLIFAFGLAFDAAGIAAALFHRYLWSSDNFLATFTLLVAMGPVHECAVYACSLHNTALTTLVAGGFKSTALSTYRSLVASAIASEPDPALDQWDALGMAISSLASLVYTYAWWIDARVTAAAKNSQISFPTTYFEEDSKEDPETGTFERRPLLRLDEDDDDDESQRRGRADLVILDHPAIMPNKQRCRSPKPEDSAPPPPSSAFVDASSSGSPSTPRALLLS